MKAFIDVGAYDGDTLAIALNKYKHCDLFYGFEAFKRYYDKVVSRFKDDKRVILYHAAANIVDEKDTKLYLHKDINKWDAYASGNSLFDTKNNVSKEHWELVDSISIPRFIDETFSESDEVILKLNAEGVEYPILNQMLKDRSIRKIKMLFCEWHYRKIAYPEDKHKQLLSDLAKANVVVYSIDDMKNLKHV